MVNFYQILLNCKQNIRVMVGHVKHKKTLVTKTFNPYLCQSIKICFTNGSQLAKMKKSIPDMSLL